MKSLAFSLCFLMSLEAGAANKAVSKPAKGGTQEKQVSQVAMTGHEISGVDRGRLNLVEADEAELSTMKAIDDSDSSWNRRVKETVEELSWW